MTIKEKKQFIENSVVNIIKKMVGEGVEVQSAYDINNGVMNVLLLEKHMSKENADHIERLLIYNTAFTEETGIFSLQAFARVYIYDNFGIKIVVNEPATVDDNFISAIKQGIINGLNTPEPFTTENKEQE